ncbi:MAG: hypothetical protein M3220_10385 [Chloroflexota bacterium]|nr:hypothetical protein [Chloroflexota bacterium]
MQPVETLTAAEREQMFRLLMRYFEGTTRNQFEQDLAEKESVILLRDRATEQVQGFSTLMRIHTIVDDQPIVAFFSGDTIVEHSYWGESLLPRLWSQHVFALAATIPAAHAFWFLISSGYKTYRFLPLFFREFYPTYARSTPPDLQRILDRLAQQKFGDQYDPRHGIVRLPHATPLRPEVAQITERRLRDPHVAFFAAANPGHMRGDELACLTEIRLDNLTAAGKRMVGG